MSYLEQLTFRLAAGAMRLPDDFRRRHGAFLTKAQNDDGGFAGREGPSDLYYTGFALRGLALLGELSEEVAARAAGFLTGQIGRPMSNVDFFSLVSAAVLLEAGGAADVFGQLGSDRRQAVAQTLDRFRRADGGYAKTDRSPHSSTYHTFLAVACREMVDLPIDGVSRILELVGSRRRDDGGFVELHPLTRSGTNPTAAAVGLLRLLDAIDSLGASIRAGASGFLFAMQNDEGGLRANTQIPMADLLSTFSGLVALGDLGDSGKLDEARVRHYVEGLEQPQGGFRGAAWDAAVDTEYTFYGIGSMAVVSGLVQNDESGT